MRPPPRRPLVSSIGTNSLLGALKANRPGSRSQDGKKGNRWLWLYPNSPLSLSLSLFVSWKMGSQPPFWGQHDHQPNQDHPFPASGFFLRLLPQPTSSGGFEPSQKMSPFPPFLGGLPTAAFPWQPHPRRPYSASILIGPSYCCLLTSSSTPRHRAQDHVARLLAPSPDRAILAVLDSLALSRFSPMPPGSQLTPGSIIPDPFIPASSIHPNLPDSNAPDFLQSRRQHSHNAPPPDHLPGNSERPQLTVLGTQLPLLASALRNQLPAVPNSTMMDGL